MMQAFRRNRHVRDSSYILNASNRDLTSSAAFRHGQKHLQSIGCILWNMGRTDAAYSLFDCSSPRENSLLGSEISNHVLMTTTILPPKLRCISCVQGLNKDHGEG